MSSDEGEEPTEPLPPGEGDRDTIEMLRPEESAFASLNGDSLKSVSAVGIARFGGAVFDEGRGVPLKMNAELLNALSRSLNGFARRDNVARIETTTSTGHLQLLVRATELHNDALGGVGGPAHKAADTLDDALRARSAEEILALTKTWGLTGGSGYEALLAVLARYRLILDWQRRRNDRPIRMGPLRAGATGAVLAHPSSNRAPGEVIVGRLIAANSRQSSFIVEVRERHKRPRLIYGKYIPDLRDRIRDLYDLEVEAYVDVRYEGRGAAIKRHNLIVSIEPRSGRMF